MTTVSELKHRVEKLNERNAGEIVFIYPGHTVPDEELRGKTVIILEDNPEDYV